MSTFPLVRAGVLVVLLAAPALAQTPGAAGVIDAATEAGASPAAARSLNDAVLEAKFTAAASADMDAHFGYSVSLSGDRALVGAPSEDHDGKTSGGAAYIFVRSGDTWTQEARLTAGPFGGRYENFGFSVSLLGDRALIGSTGDQHNRLARSGSAYVFVRTGSTWTQEARLTAGDDAQVMDRFGLSVSLSSDRALIGAHRDPFFSSPNPDFQGGDPYYGSAYVFVRSGSTWTRESRLTAGADAESDDYYGRSVSLSGDRALVGAYNNGANGQEIRGAAFIYSRSGGIWAREAMLTADTGAHESGSFARIISLAGNRALINTYVFAHSGTSWVLEANLADLVDLVDPPIRGSSSALSGNRAILGSARQDTDGQLRRGAAYVFVHSGSEWAMVDMLTAGADAGLDDYFGNSVSLSGDRALIGADFDDDNGQMNSGSAYVFSLPLPVGTEASQTNGVAVGQPFPNPSPTRTRISVDVDWPQHVRADVYSLLGQRVAVAFDGTVAPGGEQIVIEVPMLTAGTYIVRVAGETFVESRRLTVVR